MNRLGRAMADPTRSRILMSLLDGPSHPAVLSRELGLTRSNVSNHLTCLRDCGIVVAEPEGRQTRYEIADPHLAAALTAGWLARGRTETQTQRRPSALAAAIGRAGGGPIPTNGVRLALDRRAPALPVRSAIGGIAVAIVDGLATGAPSTIGAAPAAWKPHIRGVLEAMPSAAYSVKPFQYAVMLPALPTGRQWMSGASPSTSTISDAAVF